MSQRAQPRTRYITGLKKIGPGPKYLMKSLTGYQGHDFTSGKTQEPAYTIAHKTKRADEKYVASPGPAAYGLRLGQTKVGNEGAPKYSMSFRTNTGKRTLPSPGPSCYSPEKHVYPASRQAPQWTMATKCQLPQHKDDWNTPGPNKYLKPSRLGGTEFPDLPRAPAYSMTFRKNKAVSTAEQSPGPAGTNPTPLDLYKPRPPAYSCSFRTDPPSSKVRVPGPGAHAYERCLSADSRRRAAPAFSFGVRHAQVSVTPAFADCGEE